MEHENNNILIPVEISSLINDEAEDYAENENSAYTNDFYGFVSGAEYMYRYLLEKGLLKTFE